MQALVLEDNKIFPEQVGGIFESNAITDLMERIKYLLIESQTSLTIYKIINFAVPLSNYC